MVSEDRANLLFPCAAFCPSFWHRCMMNFFHKYNSSPSTSADAAPSSNGVKVVTFTRPKDAPFKQF